MTSVGFSDFSSAIFLGLGVGVRPKRFLHGSLELVHLERRHRGIAGRSGLTRDGGIPALEIKTSQHKKESKA